MSLASLASIPARAESTPDAKQLYAEGARRFDVGDYEQAAALFQRAYLASGAPMLLLNIGQAQRLSGACARSAASYRRYLEKVPDSSHRAEVDRRIAEMDACAREQEAETRPGEPAPASAPPAAPSEPVVASVEARGPDWRVLGWSGVAVGAAGAALGAVGLGLMLGAQSELDRVCSSAGACPRSAERDLDAFERWRAVAIGGGAVALVGAVAAAVGFALPPARAERQAASGRAVVAPWIGASQLGIGGTF